MDNLPNTVRHCSRAREKRRVFLGSVGINTQIKRLQVCHGDIKTENILITASNLVLITDFSLYEPAYFPEVSGPPGGLPGTALTVAE